MAPSAREAAAIPDEYKFSFTIEGESYYLYTHSYLGYGAEQAREGFNRQILEPLKGDMKEVRDPCLNKGYKRDAETARKEVYEGPDGSFSVVGGAAQKQCMPLLDALFVTKDECDDEALLQPFSFNCIHQPEFVAKSENFLVFENFYYVSSALGIGAKDGDKSGDQFPLITSPESFKTAAEDYCSTDWADAQESYPKDKQGKDTDTKLCFGASFSHQFLTKGLGLAEDKQITIQQEVDGSELEWALGAAYKEIADLLKVHPNLRGESQEDQTEEESGR